MTVNRNGSRTRARLFGSVALCIGFSATAAYALPDSPVVTASSGSSGTTFDYANANTLNINQADSRVVIDWTGFNIAAGQTVTFNQPRADAVALNVVTGGAEHVGAPPLTTIDGNLNANGAVFLISPGGVIVGSNARIDVGAFALATGGLDRAQSHVTSADPASGDFMIVTAPTPGGSVSVANGAVINANSGFVVFQGEAIAMDGHVVAKDGVGYIVSGGGVLRYRPASSGTPGLVLEAIAPVQTTGQGAPTMSHTGVTHALWVGIDAAGSTAAADYHGVINLDGLVETTGIKPGTTDDGVSIILGGDRGLQGQDTGSTLGLSGVGTITASHSLLATADAVALAQLSVGAGVTINAHNAIDLNGPTTVGGDVLLTHNGVAPAIGSTTLANRTIINGALVSRGYAFSIKGKTDIAGNVDIRAASDILFDGRTTLGGSLSLKTFGNGDGVAIKKTLTVAGDLTADTNGFRNFTDVGVGGRTTVTSIGDIHIDGAFASTGDASFRITGPEGAFLSSGALSSGGSVTIDANRVATTGAISALGDLGLSSKGDITLGGAATSSGQAYIASGGDTTISAGVGGSSVGVFATGALTVGSTGAVHTTGARAAPNWPRIAPGAVFSEGAPSLSGLTLAAHSLTISGPVSAGPAGGRSDVFIQPLGAQTTVVLGGSDGAGFHLTSASLSHIDARTLVFQGGAADGQGSGYDITIADLALDKSRLPELWVGTQSQRTISVTGAVTGDGSVRIGFAEDPALSGAVGARLLGFIPGEIDITGSLGAATAPLGGVSLAARNDIFMGSASFVTAARADPAFDAVKQSSALSPQLGHVWVSAATLAVAAQGRVVEQNTSIAGSGAYSGLKVLAPTAAHPFIDGLGALEGITFGSGGAAWTAHFGAGPTLIDLFGAFDTGAATPTNDEAAARLPFLLAGGLASRSSYRMNSCIFAATCAKSSIVEVGRIETPPEFEKDPGYPENLTQLFQEQALAPVDLSLVVPIQLEVDQDAKKNRTPITGSGNGDLWGGSPAPE